jgi:hypothetical protein
MAGWTKEVERMLLARDKATEMEREASQNVPMGFIAALGLMNENRHLTNIQAASRLGYRLTN